MTPNMRQKPVDCQSYKQRSSKINEKINCKEHVAAKGNSNFCIFFYE